MIMGSFDRIATENTHDQIMTQRGSEVRATRGPQTLVYRLPIDRLPI